jgi:basic membrane lipoprotein Med (substrate-binding protein (PBP1-ABC) superfamily)
VNLPGGADQPGFDQLAKLGLQEAVSKFGVAPKVLAPGYAPGDAGYERNVEENPSTCAMSSKLVIGVGYPLQQAVGTVAASYPGVHFAIIDGVATDQQGKQLKNVWSTQFREQEAGALVGVIAGMLEKDNATPYHTTAPFHPAQPYRIAASGLEYPSGSILPAVERYIAGYEWAAKMEDSSLVVDKQYSMDFTNAVPSGQYVGGASSWPTA